MPQIETLSEIEYGTAEENPFGGPVLLPLPLTAAGDLLYPFDRTNIL